jgi:hypothetical protein
METRKANIGEFLEHLKGICIAINSIMCLDKLHDIVDGWGEKPRKIAIKKQDIDVNRETLAMLAGELENFQKYFKYTSIYLDSWIRPHTYRVDGKEAREGRYLDDFLENVGHVAFAMTSVANLDRGDTILDAWKDDENGVEIPPEDIERNEERFDEAIEDLRDVIAYCKHRLSLIESIKKGGGLDNS